MYSESPTLPSGGYFYYTTNLAARVLWLFGQWVSAWRDSMIIESNNLFGIGGWHNYKTLTESKSLALFIAKRLPFSYGEYMTVFF